MAVQRARNCRWHAVFLMVCTVALGACAGAPRPSGTLSQAELVVREAERSEAPQYAALELQKARENLDSAKQAMQSKEHEKARRFAEKALVEAQLAQDKAKAASTGEAAEDLRKSIESLRDEISRASKRR